MPLYRDFDDWWTNGQHGFSSASRDIAESLWADLEPTVLAGRGDWENLLIEESRKDREHLINWLRGFSEYLETFKLEEVAGIGFYRWFADQRVKRYKEKTEIGE